MKAYLSNTAPMDGTDKWKEEWCQAESPKWRDGKSIGRRQI